MSYTKRTVITWNSPEQRSDPALDQSKIDKLATMVAEGKTDNNPIIIDDLTNVRLWVDQAAAEEWRDFILALAEPQGYTATVVIEDHHPINEVV